MDHPKHQFDADGNLLLNFGSYGGEVEVAAISGDGHRVLTVLEVDVARVWDVETGEQVAEIRPDSPLSGIEGAGPYKEPFQVFIESAALSSDGSHALLGLNDGTAVVHRVDEACPVSVLHPPGETLGSAWGVIRAVGYSPADLAMVGFPGRRVGVWSTDGTRPVAFLEAEAEDQLVGRPFVRDTLVCAVAASPDGREVFAGAVDMTAVVFDVQTGGVVLEATEHAAASLGDAVDPTVARSAEPQP